MLKTFDGNVWESLENKIINNLTLDSSIES